MGNIHRISKQLSQKMSIVDTKVTFNGCRILLGSTDPSVAARSGRLFPGFLDVVDGRASIVNLQDLYGAHFDILAKIENGDSLLA